MIYLDWLPYDKESVLNVPHFVLFQKIKTLLSLVNFIYWKIKESELDDYVSSNEIFSCYDGALLDPV